jgi:hypothetical protein
MLCFSEKVLAWTLIFDNSGVLIDFFLQEPQSELITPWSIAKGLKSQPVSEPNSTWNMPL